MNLLKTVILSLSFLSVTAQAQNLPSIFIQPNEAYVGQEYVNQQATGHTCRVIIKSIEKMNFGAHCYKVRYQFDTYSGPKQIQSEVISQLTTQDNQAQKSCAETIVEGANVSIFDVNGALLFTPFFSGSKDKGLFGGSEEHFLMMNRSSKRPVKAMFTQIKMLSENLYECENMK